MSQRFSRYFCKIVRQKPSKLSVCGVSILLNYLFLTWLLSKKRKLFSLSIYFIFPDLKWTEYAFTFYLRVVTGQPKQADLRSPRSAPSPSDHVHSLAWRVWSSVWNTFWRTRTPHTNSVATSLPRMANAAPMLLQRPRGKMGGWKVIFISWQKNETTAAFVVLWKLSPRAMRESCNKHVFSSISLICPLLYLFFL